ncbi:MAG: cytochrome c maturation protein CcmE [Actinobacteria bacterium]|nr:cytochrome c maturation protein CcmE [Actinomycetota bacterium]
MASRRNPARLVIALSVAAVLAIFLLYTSIAGGSTPAVQPSQLAQHDGRVTLGGTVVGPVTGDARGEGMRFTLRDIEGSGTVPVVYTGSVSDQFKVGREVMVRGAVSNGTFVAEKDSLVTKCPSKYTGDQTK